MPPQIRIVEGSRQRSLVIRRSYEGGLVCKNMSEDRRKEIVRRLSVDDLDRLLAKSTIEKLTERLIFLKRIYKGATLEDAADDVGWSSATGTQWTRRWNKGGLGY